MAPLPSLEDLHHLNHRGHIRVATPSTAPRIVTMVQVTGDTTVAIDRGWLATAPPADVEDLATAHFAEVRRRVDGAGSALNTLGLAVALPVAVAELFVVIDALEPMGRSVNAVLAAMPHALAGNAAEAMRAAAPLAEGWLGGFLWPLVVPAAWWVLRRGVSIMLYRHFLGERKTTRALPAG